MLQYLKLGKQCFWLFKTFLDKQVNLCIWQGLGHCIFHFHLCLYEFLVSDPVQSLILVAVLILLTDRNAYEEGWHLIRKLDNSKAFFAFETVFPQTWSAESFTLPTAYQNNNQLTNNSDFHCPKISQLTQWDMVEYRSHLNDECVPLPNLRFGSCQSYVWIKYICLIDSVLH